MAKFNPKLEEIYNIMQEILFFKGLPASGKSTEAKRICENNSNFIRLNKDDIREELGNPKWSQEFENKVLDLQRERGIEAIKSGKSIIIDDTNFAPKHKEYWEKIASQYGLNFTERFFDVAPDICIARDLEREKSVGKGVIMKMYNQYIKPTILHTNMRTYMKQDDNLPVCIIVDIDGTLALNTGRNAYDLKRVLEDAPNQPVIDLVNEASTILGKTIIVFSGREDVCEEDTRKWLDKYKVKYDHLYMRKDGDMRKDSIVKKELFDTYVKDKYYVEYVLDDRNQVVDMWRNELGLLCLQVYYGDF